MSSIKLEKRIRNKIITALSERWIDCHNDDSYHFIRDTVLNGYKGYNECTDEELVKELKQEVDNEWFEAHGNEAKLLAEIEANIAIEEIILDAK